MRIYKGNQQGVAASTLRHLSNYLHKHEIFNDNELFHQHLPTEE